MGIKSISVGPVKVECNTDTGAISVDTPVGGVTADSHGATVNTPAGNVTANTNGISVNTPFGTLGVGPGGVEYEPADPNLGPNVHVVTEHSIDLKGGIGLNATVGGAGSPISLAPIGANLGGSVGVNANLGGTDTPIRLAPIDAKVDGNISIKAIVGGSDTPLYLAPIKIEMGPLKLRPDITIEFRLFGLRIGSIKITGNTGE